MKEDEPHHVRQFQVEDGRGRRGTTKCHPSRSFALTCRASSENDWTGRHNAVRPGPGPVRMGCPVENSGAVFALILFRQHPEHKTTHGDFSMKNCKESGSWLVP